MRTASRDRSPSPVKDDYCIRLNEASGAKLLVPPDRVCNTETLGHSSLSFQAREEDIKVEEQDGQDVLQR